MTAFHVIVPAKLTYYVEAEDKDDAAARVAAAIAGSPVDPDAVWIIDAATKLSPPDQWDVEHEYECGGCGGPINPDFGRCCCS